MHLIEGVATEVYNAYFPHSIALSDAVHLGAKGKIHKLHLKCSLILKVNG